MNKSDLIDRVASKMGITRGESTQYVDVVLDAIADGLIEDGRVKITGFGSFIRRHRSARDGTKPSTGEPITIPASETCGFKAAPALRQKLTDGVLPAGQVEPKPVAREAVRETL
ncbi:MAG: HU family DNA-binding protein [Planctomycetota bacterium]